MSGPFTNSGIVSLAQGARMSVTGNYTQTTTGSLSIEVGGLLTSQFGRLLATGAASLSGTLNVALANGFIPALNDRFQFMTFASRSGFFATQNGLNLGGGLAFQVDQTDPLDLELVTVASGAPLLGDGGALPENGAVPSLTDADLTPIVDAAKAQWLVSDLSQEQAAALAAVQFTITDLDGATLGRTLRTTIQLDHTAAGHGWFIDSTPQENAEFHFVQGLSQWMADGQSPASGRIDLLTTVMHELGHVLGLGDQQAQGAKGTLMTETLPDGVRRTVVTEPAGLGSFAAPTLDHPTGNIPAGFPFKNFLGSFPPGASGVGARPSDLPSGHSSIDWSAEEAGTELVRFPLESLKTQGWFLKFINGTNAEARDHLDAICVELPRQN